MQAQTFSDRFIESQGQPILHDGQEVHLAFSLPVESGTTIQLRWITSAPSPVQGIRVIGKNCELEAVGQRSKQFVLWNDTAPEVTQIVCVRAKAGSNLRLINVWRDEKFGSTFHGMNYSGMLVKPSEDGGFLLHCSDGWGPPDFQDLVVGILPRDAK